MNTAPVELVIFDCDGVLVDSERLALRLNLEIGPTLGWPITEEEALSQFLGRSNAAILAIIAERLTPAAAAEWDERFRLGHAAAVDEHLNAVEGIEGALDEIDQIHELQTCIASSGSHDKLRHTLGRTGLWDRFDGRIFSATEVAHGKPAPDLFLCAAARMGVDPRHCLVVEDSSAGVEAARAAGMRSVGYAGGLTPPEWLEGPGTRIFEQMRDLPRLITDASWTPS